MMKYTESTFLLLIHWKGPLHVGTANPIAVVFRGRRLSSSQRSEHKAEPATAEVPGNNVPCLPQGLPNLGCSGYHVSEFKETMELSIIKCSER